MISYGKVGVLSGGYSAEREISLMSGKGVLTALREQGIDVHAFDPAQHTLAELAQQKFDRKCLYTEKRLQAKKIVKIKVKNSLGKNKGTTIADPADYYIFAQENAMAVISYEELKPYLVSVPDGIEAHVPFEKLSMIFTPADVKEIVKVDFDYKAVKAAAQRKLIESIS